MKNNARKNNQSMVMGQERKLSSAKQRDSFNKKIGSMATIPTHVRSNFKLTSNITSLVKKYAVYIFKYLSLDKNKDEIQFEQFK